MGTADALCGAARTSMFSRPAWLAAPGRAEKLRELAWRVR
eukprot:CAMPEP_0175260630 /NCGR_PEP_ID=MMETSP0093-20121207/40347_1 /TAXON_ID=311494 /ORGANISM="Alexandrium monilatum, Strain CCMP3105" /LENGTH=39 /DNA_ID= /DNA_START= /DNA_END= /DNA_ORIENTATION=